MKDKVLADLIAAQRDLLNRSTELLRQAMRQCTMYQNRLAEVEAERDKAKADLRECGRLQGEISAGLFRREQAKAAGEPFKTPAQILDDLKVGWAKRTTTKAKRRGRPQRTKPVAP